MAEKKNHLQSSIFSDFSSQTQKQAEKFALLEDYQCLRWNVPTESLASYKAAHYFIPVGENPVQRDGWKMRAARGTSMQQGRKKPSTQKQKQCSVRQMLPQTT